MVEPVGATLGALGLAGLLTVCLDCFDFVRTGTQLGKDFVILQGQLSSLRIRLFAWSKACGFMSAEGYDKRLDHPTWRGHIHTQLNCISLLFLDAAKLIKRYDLQERYTLNENGPGSLNAQFVEESSRDFLRRIQATKRRSGLTGGFLWSLKDKKDFTELLQRSEKCIEALELVTKNLDLFESQRQAISHEILSLSDAPELEAIAVAGTEGDFMSDAASLRLSELREQSDVSSHTATFYTAESNFALGSTLADADERRIAVRNLANIDPDQNVRDLDDIRRHDVNSQPTQPTFGEAVLTSSAALEEVRLTDAMNKESLEKEIRLWNAKTNDALEMGPTEGELLRLIALNPAFAKLAQRQGWSLELIQKGQHVTWIISLEPLPESPTVRFIVTTAGFGPNAHIIETWMVVEG